MRTWVLAILFGTLLSVVARADEPRLRVQMSGTSVADLALAIDTRDIDDADPVSVARARAEIDLLLEAQLELQFARVLAAEYLRVYPGVLDAATLKAIRSREDVEDLNARLQRLAKATVRVMLGKREDVSPTLLLLPVIAVIAVEGEEIQRVRYRLTMQQEETKAWRVARSEYLCPQCDGSGKTGTKTCPACAGAIWVAKPISPLPEGLAAEAPSPVAAGTDPQAVASAFLRLRHQVSRYVFARFAAVIGPPYREYARRVMSPAAIGTAQPASPFSGDITYAPLTASATGTGVLVEVRESLQPSTGPVSNNNFDVVLTRGADGRFFVASFGTACLACRGSGRCAACDGMGLIKGTPCQNCEGTRACLACQGKGTLPTDLLSPRF